MTDWENDLALTRRLSSVYGESQVSQKKQQLQLLAQSFQARFARLPQHLFKVPGRIEISGNHMDHQNGLVLTAAIDRELFCLAATCPGQQLTLYLGANGPFLFDLTSSSDNPPLADASESLFAAVIQQFRSHGHHLAGAELFISGDLVEAKDLRAQAALAVLLAKTFSVLFLADQLEPLMLSQLARKAEAQVQAENPGLMDALTCAVGGLLMMDFREMDRPLIQPLDFDFSATGTCLVLVHAGTGLKIPSREHALLNREMHAVAQALGADHCRDLQERELVAQLPHLREKVGDHAIMRVIHYLAENRRVNEQVKALQEQDLTTFLRLVRESGDSSWKWLQEMIHSQLSRDRGLGLVLALSEFCLRRRERSAFRVHGGGQAGMVQVFLDQDQLSSYRSAMEKVFGQGAVEAYQISKTGVACLSQG